MYNFPFKQNLFVDRNAKGSDWFCGDIHGDWVEMIELLLSRGFSFERDRLFLTGDIIDRGADSRGAILLLQKSSWLYSVAGNHELMFVESEHDDYERQMHIRNGGDWTKGESQEKLRRLRQIIKNEMPLSITINSKFGKIGISHASSPDNWARLERDELKYAECYRISGSTNSDSIYTKEIDISVHGHTGSKVAYRVGNNIWIDTKMQTGVLTLIREDEIDLVK